MWTYTARAPFDFELILVPLDGWLWKSFNSAVNDTIVPDGQIAMVDLGGELGRRRYKTWHVFRLLPRDHLFRYLRRILADVLGADADLVSGGDAEFEFVAQNQVLYIGLAMADVVIRDVPFTLFARAFVTFFDLFDWKCKWPFIIFISNRINTIVVTADLEWQIQSQKWRYF